MTEEQELQEENAKLSREVRELKAQLASTSHFAQQSLKYMTRDRMKGGSVIVDITTLGGRFSTGPFQLKDGLSEELMKALNAQLVETYEEATTFKPSLKL